MELSGYPLYFNSNRCGRVKNEYEVSVTQGPEVSVNIKGMPVTVKTIQLVREGVWYTNACGGSGKKYMKVLFSPDLNEIVHDEYQTYDRGGPLFAGEKLILDSIN